MSLDTPTLTAQLCLQLGAVALALSVITGWRGSPALRWAVAALWAQLLSWLLVLATPLSPLVGMIGSYVLGMLTFCLTLQALQGWLGPRPGARWCWALPAFTLLALLLAHETLWVRRGLPNLLMAASLALVCLALIVPPSLDAPHHRRWRAVLLLPMLVLTALTAWRAVIGFMPELDYPSLRSGHPLALGVLMVGNLATMLSALVFLAAWRGEAENALREAARSDPLTGLANRRELERQALAMVAAAQRHGEPLVALIIDLDHFKRVNDTHGHAKGDAALQLTARLLREQARPSDCVARLGGEEFVLLLGRSGAQAAAAVDRRLRRALQEAAPRELGLPLDFSAGWAAWRSNEPTLQDLLRRADAALYQAKATGRGRLCPDTLEADDPPR